MQQQKTSKVKLSDVVHIDPRDKVNLAEHDHVTFVSMSSVDAERATISSSEVKKFSEVKRKGFSSFRENDVLFAKITPCMQNKKSAIARNLVNGNGYGSTEFYVLRPSSQILSEYLLHLLRLPTVITAAKNHFTGTAGQQRVPRDFIANLEFVLPSLNEQLRAVSLFQEIDDLRQKQRKAIELTRQMIPALFYEMFGDLLTNNQKVPVAVLKDCCSNIKSGFACGKSSKDGALGAVHLRPMNISPEGEFTMDGSKFIDSILVTNFEEYSVQEGDVLFNNTNSREWVGKTCYVQKNIDNAAFSNHITRIRTNERLNPVFLAVQLHRLQQTRVFQSLCNKWIGQAGINNQKLLGLSILFPVREEQDAFAEKAQELYTLLRQQESSLQMLNVLFDSTLQQVFSAG